MLNILGVLLDFPFLEYLLDSLKISNDEESFIASTFCHNWLSDYHKTPLHPLQNALTLDFQSISNIVLQIISLTNIFVRI